MAIFSLFPLGVSQKAKIAAGFKGIHSAGQFVFPSPLRGRANLNLDPDRFSKEEDARWDRQMGFWEAKDDVAVAIYPKGHFGGR